MNLDPLGNLSFGLAALSSWEDTKFLTLKTRNPYLLSRYASVAW